MPRTIQAVLDHRTNTPNASKTSNRTNRTGSRYRQPRRPGWRVAADDRTSGRQRHLGLLGSVDSVPTATRPFARAVIIRQALELALVEHWNERSPSMTASTTASQLSCLRPQLGSDLVGSLKLAWSGLSRSLHSTGYDHPPTDDELDRYRTAVERLITSAPL